MLFVVTLLFYACLVAADLNYDVCEPITTNCGLIPPVVPDAFVMKSLEVDELNKMFTWVEKYFDPANLRARVLTISNGKETTFLFDYEKNEVTSYMRLHPGAPLDRDPSSSLICLTQDIQDSNFKILIGFKQSELFKKRSTMYNSFEELNFGGPYNYAQSNETDDLVARNSACNIFLGCTYDPNMDKTLWNKFYWSNDLITSSGAVTVPMRIVSTGGYYPDPNNPVWTSIKTINEVVFFDDTPVMPQTLFQPPPRMRCEPRDTSVKIPKMSETISTRIESVITIENFQGDIKQITQDWYEEMWYDYGRQLARQDFYPSVLEDITLLQFFEQEQPISAVYDFNTGIAYYTEKTYGKCVVAQIPEFTYMAKKSDDGKTLEMVKKEEVFNFDNEKLFYKGKYETRDILCDTWSGDQDVKLKDGVQNAYREVYFTTDGWHQETDKEEKYSIPVQETRIYNTKHDDQEAIGYMEINYYKFKMSSIPLSTYDISGCVENHERRSFVLQFKNDYREVINNHKNVFTDSFRLNTAQYGTLESVLRVQEIDVLFSEETGNINVYFTLLEKPKITGDVKYVKKAVDLSKAVSSIKDTLDKKIFKIVMNFDLMAEPTVLEPIENTFKEVDFQTNSLVDVKYSMSVNDVQSYQGQPNTETEKEKDKSTRYDPAAVGGMGFGMMVVGILLGVIIMTFYVKKLKKANDETEIEFASASQS